MHFLGFEHFFENARSRPTLPPRNQKLFSAALFLRVGAASISLRPSVHRARRGNDTLETVEMAPRWPRDGPKMAPGLAADTHTLARSALMTVSEENVVLDMAPPVTLFAPIFAEER